MRAFFFCVLISVSPAHADSLFGGGSQGDMFNTLDERIALEENRSISFEQPVAHIPGFYDGEYDGPFLEMARAAARRHDIPEDIFLRLVEQESNWNPNAESHKGALGLAQLMPETAELLGVDPLVPEQNLDGGARYLREQYDAFGTWHLALAAYNAGPNAVLRYGGIPPFSETENYVEIILGS